MFSVIVGFLGISMLAAAPADAAATCQPLTKVAHHHDSNGLAVYEQQGFAWKLIADAKGKLVVENASGAENCETSVDDLTEVYFAPNDTIALRSVQIASDDMYFLSSKTCKSIRPDLSIADLSPRRLAQKLKTVGFCLEPDR